MGRERIALSLLFLNEVAYSLELAGGAELLAGVCDELRVFLDENLPGGRKSNASG